MVTFDYTNTFDVSHLLIEKIQGANADAITNITITIKSDVKSFMVNLITLGIAQAKVFSVEGDLVSIEGGTSPKISAFAALEGRRAAEAAGSSRGPGLRRGWTVRGHG